MWDGRLSDLRHMREKYVRVPAEEQALQTSLRGVEKKQLPHLLCTTNMLLHGIENPSFVRRDNTLARPYISYGDADRVDFGSEAQLKADSAFTWNNSPLWLVPVLSKTR